MLPLPSFDHNGVLPPHVGNPTDPDQLSPYPCTSLELCRQFATSPERIAILNGFLRFRERLRAEGLVTGFQWLGGSFLEDVETLRRRPPGDIDLITVYWGYDTLFQSALGARFPEFVDFQLSKISYSVDHYFLDADFSDREIVIMQARYWSLLFCHNRDKLWKGMLKIDINTPAEDTQALAELGTPPIP